MKGMQRIPLQVGSDFALEPVRANFPDAQAAPSFKIVGFEPIEEPVQPQVEQPRDVSTMAADTVYSFAKGAGSLVKGLGWLTRSDTIQEMGQTAEDFWGERQSANLQQQLQRVGEAEGVSETVSALWNNPGAIGDFIASSLPMMVPGMGVGAVGARGVAAFAGNAARNAAIKAGVGEAAAIEAGRVAARRAALRFAVASNMLGEGAVSGGVTGAEVEKFALEHGATPEEARAAANDSALLAGALTTAGASIGAGLESRAMLGQLKDRGVVGFAKNVGKEALEEAIQNPGEEYAGYAGKVQFDPTQTYDPGKAAVIGAVAGGAMGAGVHVAGRLSSRDDPPEDAIRAEDAGLGGQGGLDGEYMPAERPQLTGQEQPGNVYDMQRDALPEQKQLTGPEDRQMTTARGLLKHSSKPSPDMLKRLMRVDDETALKLFQMWQGESNGADGQSTPPVAAPGGQGQGADVLGGQIGAVALGNGGAAGAGADLAAADALPGSGEPEPVGDEAAGPSVGPLDVMAHAAATSPFNGRAEPTEAQRQAGNYAKGHIKLQGMDISIENPAGSVRSGTDASGKPWETQMQHHYGYIKGTVGHDKDHLDVFLTPAAEEADTAYVIDQINPKTGKFDEHKIIIGAQNEEDAKAIYHANYQEGWQGFAGIKAMPMADFKVWSKSPQSRRPVVMNTVTRPDFEGPALDYELATQVAQRHGAVVIEHPNEPGKYSAVTKEDADAMGVGPAEPPKPRVRKPSPEKAPQVSPVKPAAATPAPQAPAGPPAAAVKDRKPVKRAPNARTLLGKIVEMGGINTGVAQDFGADPSRIDRYKHGISRVFTADGFQDPSLLAEYLAEDFPQLNGENPAETLMGMVARAIHGNDTLTESAMLEASGKEQDRIARAEVERQAKKLGISTKFKSLNKLQEELLAMKERRHAQAVEKLADRAKARYAEALEALQALLDDPDLQVELDRLASKSPTVLDFYKAATGEMKARRERILSYRAGDMKSPFDEDNDGQAETGSGSLEEDREAAGGRAEGSDSPAGREAGAASDSPAFELAGQSSEEVAAAEQAQRDAEVQRLREEQAAEQRRRADADRDSFTLTGSDRAADVAVAQGQTGLFDAPVSQPKTETRAETAQDKAPVSQQDTRATLDADGRRTDGKPIQAGDVFRTLTGRDTSPFPKQKGEKYASQWLIDNATAEAESRGDTFNAQGFGATKPLKSGELAMADRDSMLMYLFDQQPDVVPSILKPLVAENKSPAKPATDKGGDSLSAGRDNKTTAVLKLIDAKEAQNVAIRLPASSAEGKAARAESAAALDAAEKGVREAFGTEADDVITLPVQKLYALHDKLNAPESIAGKPVSEMSDKALEQIAQSKQPAAEKAKAELEKRAEQQEEPTDEQLHDAGKQAFTSGRERAAWKDEPWAGSRLSNMHASRWLKGYDAAKTDADVTAARDGRELIALPSEYPTDEVDASYSHISHNGTARAKMDRDAFVTRVHDLYDEAMKDAETPAQREAAKTAATEFKDEYLRRLKPVINVRGTTYSGHIAGGANLNAKQANNRNSALDNALSRFAAWESDAAQEVKRAVLQARSPEQLNAIAEAKAQKEAAKHAKQQELITSIIEFKSGDVVKFGGYNIARVSNDRDGYPSSVTVDATDLTDNKFDLAKILFNGDKAKLRAAVDEARANAAPAPQQSETVPDGWEYADGVTFVGAVEAEVARLNALEDGSEYAVHGSAIIKRNIKDPIGGAIDPNRTLSLSDVTAIIDRIHEGELTAAELKAAYTAFERSSDAIRAELAKMTKPELFKAFPVVEYRYKNDNKDRVVEAAYNALMQGFVIADSVSWSMGEKYEDVIRGYVDRTTDEKIKAYAEDRAKRRKDYADAAAANKAALEDPKTLDDFRSVMRKHMQDGKTRAEAFLMLTPEQRMKYDELDAESTRTAREARKNAQRTEVKVAAQTVDGQVIETKHTKTGEPLFVVKAAERVERDVYNQWNATAKRLGGWYSSYRGGGAVPGFQFKTRENADAFLQYLGGDKAEAQEAVQARRDSFEDDRSQSAVERLNEMADRMDSRAQEVLDADRKTNTERRARMAAGIEAAAEAEKALAKTMRNVATAIEEGRAKFLDGIRTKSQVEALRGFVRTAKDNELRAKYPSYADQEKRKGEPATAETADYAEFPAFTAYRSDLASLARQMLEVDGTKKLGQQLMSVADDVSKAFEEWVKEPGNFYRLSVYTTKGGERPVFPTKERAERAIAASGYKGKAIAWSVKRGEHTIILSPSEAINQGIWKGDGDKRITLTKEAGFALVDAIGRRGNKANRLAVPWQFQNAADRLKALSRMGIETPAEYRSALREFIGLQETATRNRVRELELSMAGRKNDGLDFFPTPEEVADQMVEAAEISPDMAVLEPSAGMGHIADRIRAAGAEPEVMEFSSDRRALLQEKGYHVAGNDFLDLKPREFYTYGDVFRAPDGQEGIMRGQGGIFSSRVRLVDESGAELGKYDREDLTGIAHRGVLSGYDRIIMNPPFSNRRDAEHVRHAYELLKPGGRIVAIMGEGVFFGQDKKAEAFREWLEEVGGTSEKLPEGSFMDPSLPVNTGVNARMVVIDKPKAGLESRAGLNFAAEMLVELADEEGLFSIPVSEKKTLRGVIQDVIPGAEYHGEHTMPEEKRDTGADHRYVFSTPEQAGGKKGHEFTVFTTDDGKVWIDVHKFEAGGGGQLVYAAVGNYAFNTGKKFIGDPAGMTVESTIRRTSAMLASALRHGTTEHIEPHHRQEVGDPEKGIEPLKWWGNDFDKLKSLIHTFVTTTFNRFPPLANYRYDFATNQYVDRSGRPVGADRFTDAERFGVARAAFAGGKTLRRAIFLKSLLEAEDRGIEGITQRVITRARQIAEAAGPLFSKGTAKIQSSNTAAVRAVVEKFQKQFKGTEALDIRVVGTVGDIPARYRPSPYAEGVFHDDVGLIYIVSGQVTPARAFQVLMHEAVGHYGLSRMMGDKFEGILKHVNRVARAEVQGDIYEPGDPEYATVDAVRLRYPEASEEEVAQEVLARMAETGSSKLGQLRAMIRQWLRDMARALGFDLDVTTAELNDLIHQASAYMRRGGNLDEDAEPTGLVAASRAKEGVTNTPAFRRWFGDSKVVDADGNPLVVYHGTQQDISAFDENSGDKVDPGWLGRGFYFTSNPDTARYYATNARTDIGGGNVMPVYLSIKNPYYATIQDKEKGALRSFGGKTEFAKARRDELIAEGYDGVILDFKKNGGFADELEIVAFYPEQIKSAIGNNGGFDPANPDIRESRRGLESRAAAVKRPRPSKGGLIDRTLRAAGGDLLAKKITGPAYDYLIAAAGRIIPEKVKAGVVSDYGLDEAYTDRRTALQTNQQKAARQTKTLIDGLMDLDRAQSRVAYLWLNNKGEEADKLLQQLPLESRKVLGEVKDWIDQLSREAVRLGQLSEEAFERNRYAYLHRSYAKHDLNTEDKGWKAERAKAIKILGDQYKGRGLQMDIDPDRIQAPDGWWKGEMKGKKVRVLKKDGQKVYLAESMPIPPRYQAWGVDGVWEIRSSKGSARIVLWRDFSPEERERMGELDEAKYAVARTLNMMNRDIEVGRFHEWVAENYGQLPEEFGGQLADASESMLRAFQPDEFVQVSTAKVPGTGVFKYGDLAGMVVPGPVWNDIRQITAGRFEPFGSAYASILRAWKLSKTALTPTTHLNNVMGNFIMADMHDVGARDVYSAARTMLAAAQGDPAAKALWERFEDSGATQGMFTTHELRKETLEPLIKALREEVGMADDESALLKASEIMARLLHGKFGEAWGGAKAAVASSTAGRLAGKAVGKAQDAYQAEDEVFRFAAFLKGINDGRTDEEAGKTSRKAFLDYNINAPWINTLRGTALPFIAFTYRALPMLAETAAKKPWKLAKYMMIAGGLNALAYAMLGLDADDEKRERAYMPEEKAGKIWGIVPKLVRMPWNSENTLKDGTKTSDPVFLDIRRWVPVGDIVDFGQDHSALPLIPQPMTPGGPIMLIAEFLTNRSMFTGKELSGENDNWLEKAAKVTDHFYKGFAPNVPGLPGTYATKKITDAYSGREDAFGRTYDMSSALASGVGIKVAPYPTDNLKRNAVLGMKSKMKDLEEEKGKLRREAARKGMTPVELKEKIDVINQKKIDLAKRYSEKGK